MAFSSRLFGMVSLMGVMGTSAAYAQEAATDVQQTIVDALQQATTDLSPQSDTTLDIENTLRIADSIRVADSLRIVDMQRQADSLRQVYTADSVRMERHALTSLQTSWSEWRATKPYPDTTLVVETPKSASARQRAARAEAQRKAALAQRMDSMKIAAGNQAMLQSTDNVLTDFRLPLIASATPPVEQLPRYSELAPAATPRRAQIDACPDDAAAEINRDLALNRDRQAIVDRFFAAHPFKVHYLRGKMLKAPEKEMMKKDDLLRGTQIDVAGYDINYQPLKGGKPSADKWHYHGSSTFQMTQTAMSDNWYKGGENNMTVYSNQKLQIKRYDVDKITTFESTIELKLGGYYTQADTIHSMRVNDNQLSIDVKYGYKAWKKWYYSTSMTFKTPIFNYYPANSRTVKSAFLSPAELNLNIGMDYSYENKRKTVSYSLMLAPLSYYMKYVNNQKVSVTQYGIAENRRTLNQIGSSLTSKLSWKINDNVSWSSRLYIFTSYDSFLGEFENTFTFKVNRYLSANIMLYPRIDDGTAYDPWQMKEMLTFGFNYVWK